MKPLVSICAALLLSCGMLLAQEKVYEIRFGTAAPDDTPWAEQLKAIKKRVEAESGGRIKMKLFLGSKLGGEQEMIDQLRRGEIQGGGFSTGAMAEIVPELQVLELPCMFSTVEEADYVIDNHMREPLEAALRRRNFEVIAWGENGFRSFGTTNRLIRRPEDLQGLVLRVQESRVHAAAFEALGIDAKPKPLTEVLPLLNSGAIDGFDNTPLFTTATGWFNSIKYFCMTEHIYQPAVVVYQAEFYQSLPADLQAILKGNVEEESRISRAGVRDLTEELLRGFEERDIQVIRLTDEEKIEFEEMTWDVHEQFRDEIGSDLLDLCYDAIREYREQHEE